MTSHFACDYPPHELKRPDKDAFECGSVTGCQCTVSTEMGRLQESVPSVVVKHHFRRERAAVPFPVRL